MQLKSIQLVNFRNYANVQLDFSPKINVLVGTNGSGKTNLLDAIHYLSLTKSAFSSSDNYSIRNDEKFFSIRGLFSSGASAAEIFCAVQHGSKKVVREGANEYQKLSDHIGKYPVVLIAPDDTMLVKEGSEERRKFFDSIISQLDRPYLESLIEYNQALRQRNSLLKMFGETNSFDPIALDSYDHVMARTGGVLSAERSTFVTSFVPVFRKFYSYLTDGETADIFYQSDLAAVSFDEGLARSRRKDLTLMRSTFGVHRDDYIFTLGANELKRVGSQGQQKSFIIALKLAQFELIKETTGITPILLLDDIFDKLDDQRISKLLEMIKENRFGQLFLTDARPDRTRGMLERIDVRANVYTVSKGEIIKYEQAATK